LERKKITVFIPYFKSENALKNIDTFSKSKLIEKIYLISDKTIKPTEKYDVLNSNYPFSSEVMKMISHNADTDFILLIISESVVHIDDKSLNRLILIAEQNNSGWLYTDFYLPNGKVYIEFWGMESDPKYLERKKVKLEIYRKYDLRLIELDDNDIANLDDHLPKKLLKYGIKVY